MKVEKFVNYTLEEIFGYNISDYIDDYSSCISTRRTIERISNNKAFGIKLFKLGK